jgi:NifB/MoaA-like Fe-S oxidoreductase
MADPGTSPEGNCGTILTGEMFGPILARYIEMYNSAFSARLKVVKVPNTYFGGDVSVAGLLTGQDLSNVRSSIEGDFVIIPASTIKSDEPVLLDGMTFSELQSRFPVPVYPMDLGQFLRFLTK